ncbi:MAG: spore maturation protein [Lachnospiraceae bacterium]|nr:spore maturation protein [Lachnospiraceae bacterium]
MELLTGISNLLIPMIIFYIVSYGLVSGVKVYESFLKGAKDGLEVAVQMMPTLVGLLVAVGVLRASGFLDFLGEFIGGIVAPLGIPAPIVPLILLKLFSGSAATGMVLDLFRTYGPDSFVGTMASILMSCSETVFYTISVYFLAAKVTKTRYTLTGALFAVVMDIVISIWLTRMLVG